MPSPESFPKSTPESTGTGEQDFPREKSMERGAKGYEAYEYAQNLEQYRKNQARIDEIDRRMAELDAEEKAKLDAAEAAKLAAAEALKPQQSAPETPKTPEPQPEQPESQEGKEQDRAAAQAEAEAKGKKNGTFKKVIAFAATAAIGGLITAGILTGGFGLFGHNQAEAPAQPNNQPSYNQSVDAAGNKAETITGIRDGYDKDGMWLDSYGYRFADASKLAEIHDLDEVEMLKDVAENQVESLADYIANLPRELQPEGFEGLSLTEAETRLQNLSNGDFDKVLAYTQNVIDSAFTRRVTVNGTMDNAYMGVKNPDGSGTYLTAEQFRAQYPGAKLTHDMMELVKCTSNEHNLEVTDLYWLDQDGNEIGHMTVKMTPIYDKGGAIIGFDGCTQVLTPQGSPVYSNLPKVTEEKPETPPPAEEKKQDEEQKKPDNPPSDDEKKPDTEKPENPPSDQETPDKPTPTPGTPDKPVEPTPEPAKETPVAKDTENAKRVIEQTFEDAAEDIGTDTITTYIREEITDDSELTAAPVDQTESYTTNTDSQRAETITTTTVSPENSYSTDTVGANDQGGDRVVDDYDAQKQADENETPVSQAPTEGTDVTDILSELGIN